MSTPDRIYKAQFLGWPDEALVWANESLLDDWQIEQAIDSKQVDGAWLYQLVREGWQPDGWEEYARVQWPAGIDLDGEHFEVAPFFWPSTDRLYRSRSSAQARVDLITQWGGKAVVIESDLTWRTVATANAERAAARKQKRLDRLYAEIRKVRES